jgi:hypothetical protein
VGKHLATLFDIVEIKLMKIVIDDDGREAAGFKGSAGDCVCRAIAIASGVPYQEVYDRLAEGAGTQRITKRQKRCHEHKGWAPPKRTRSAANGVSVKRLWFRRYMHELGFEWMATMKIGSGCKAHLAGGELPMGRLIVSVSKHYAVIDGVLHDTYDPSRGESRCVYGYWKLRAGRYPSHLT